MRRCVVPARPRLGIFALGTPTERERSVGANPVPALRAFAKATAGRPRLRESYGGLAAPNRKCTYPAFAKLGRADRAKLLLICLVCKGCEIRLGGTNTNPCPFTSCPS